MLSRVEDDSEDQFISPRPRHVMGVKCPELIITISGDKENIRIKLSSKTFDKHFFVLVGNALKK